MAHYELAELNIAHLIAPLESPALVDFVDNLDRINSLAEAAPGFVWRLKTEDGNATSLRPFGDDYIVNLSVWQDVDTLFEYVYRTAHAPFLSRRKSWFQHMREAYMVLWWVPRGARPDVDEAREKLDLLRANGPSPAAFTFKRRFPPPVG